MNLAPCVRKILQCGDFCGCWKCCKLIGSTAEIHEHIHNSNNHLRGSRASDSMATHASQERAVFLAYGVHQPRSSSFFVARCEYCEFKSPREPSLYGTYHGVRSDHLLDGCRIEARQTCGLAALGGHMAITRNLHAVDHCRNRSSRLGLARIGTGIRNPAWGGAGA